MKIRNLFFIALASLALIACGSEKKPATAPQPLIPVQEEPQPLVPDATEDTAEVQEAVELALDGDGSKPGYIVISKESMTLTLFDVNGKAILRFPVAVGKNYGNKKRVGDMKTPEGKFSIQQIQPASAWSHDFHDGKGNIPHAYGDWFIRLLTPPHTGIGIHGTHAPESIGTRATEGCIRLHNENLNKLKPLVKVGMEVTIETSKLDMEADGKRAEEIETTQQASNAGIELRPNTEESKPAVESKPVDIKPAEETPKTEIKPTEEDVATAYFPGEVIEHTIEKDQFLGHIANKYNTTTAKILELNEGLVPEKLKIGQKIKVQPNTAPAKSSKPTTPAVAEDPNGEYYTVKSGDVLGKIANKYNTTVAKIKELNNMENDNIRVNQRIRVK